MLLDAQRAECAGHRVERHEALVRPEVRALDGEALAVVLSGRHDAERGRSVGAGGGIDDGGQALGEAFSPDVDHAQVRAARRMCSDDTAVPIVAADEAVRVASRRADGRGTASEQSGEDDGAHPVMMAMNRAGAT